MTKVLFVGDRPSKTNAHEDVAFVGAKCFPTLITWIQRLKPDFYVCVNSYNESDWDKIRALKNQGFKVIALGKQAADLLDTMNIVHFQLPHPSGLNRKLNDKQYIERELRVAFDYIHDTYVGVLSEDQRSGAV